MAAYASFGECKWGIMPPTIFESIYHNYECSLGCGVFRKLRKPEITCIKIKKSTSTIVHFIETR